MLKKNFSARKVENKNSIYISFRVIGRFENRKKLLLWLLESDLKGCPEIF